MSEPQGGRARLSVTILSVTVIAVLMLIGVALTRSMGLRRLADSLVTKTPAELDKPLGQLVTAGARAIPEILRLRQKQGPERSMVYTAALSGIAAKSPAARAAVHALLIHPDPRVRVIAAGFWISDTADRRVLAEALESKDKELRFEAAFKLNALDEAFDRYRRIVAALVERLDDTGRRLSTGGGQFHSTTVGELALLQLQNLTGLKGSAAIRKWWALPGIQDKNNAELLLEAMARGAEVTRVPAKAQTKIRAWLAKEAAKAKSS